MFDFFKKISPFLSFFPFFPWYNGRPIFSDIPTCLVPFCPILLEIPTCPKTRRSLWTFPNMFLIMIRSWSVKFLYTSLYNWSDLKIYFDSELFPEKNLCDSSIMIEKVSIYTMNALNKSSELWQTSVNRKARPVVEEEHDKNWNDHGYIHVLPFLRTLFNS